MVPLNKRTPATQGGCSGFDEIHSTETQAAIDEGRCLVAISTDAYCRKDQKQRCRRSLRRHVILCGCCRPTVHGIDYVHKIAPGDQRSLTKGTDLGFEDADDETVWLWKVVQEGLVWINKVDRSRHVKSYHQPPPLYVPPAAHKECSPRATVLKCTGGKFTRLFNNGQELAMGCFRHRQSMREGLQLIATACTSVPHRLCALLLSKAPNTTLKLRQTHATYYGLSRLASETLCTYHRYRKQYPRTLVSSPVVCEPLDQIVHLLLRQHQASHPESRLQGGQRNVLGPVF